MKREDLIVQLAKACAAQLVLVRMLKKYQSLPIPTILDSHEHNCSVLLREALEQKLVDKTDPIIAAVSDV